MFKYTLMFKYISANFEIYLQNVKFPKLNFNFLHFSLFLHFSFFISSNKLKECISWYIVNTLYLYKYNTNFFFLKHFWNIEKNPPSKWLFECKLFCISANNCSNIKIYFEWSWEICINSNSNAGWHWSIQVVTQFKSDNTLNAFYLSHCK